VIRGQWLKRQSNGGADAGEDQGFGEGLADESPTAAAHGGAHGELAFAEGGADQHEVGDVGAGDEEEEDDSAHKS
jgi:hypothetical protein